MGQKGPNMLNRSKIWITKSAAQVGLLTMNGYEPIIKTSVAVERLSPLLQSGGSAFDFRPKSQLLAVTAWKSLDSVPDQTTADSLQMIHNYSTTRHYKVQN